LKECEDNECKDKRLVSREDKIKSSLRDAKQARPIILAVTPDATRDHNYARLETLTRVLPFTST